MVTSQWPCFWPTLYAVVAHRACSGACLSVCILLLALKRQEALLPPTDRATRCVSRNLVNCRTTTETGCTTTTTAPV